MSDAMLNEIYQELYAIRAELQSMNMRGELQTIQGLLEKLVSEVESLNRNVSASSARDKEMEEYSNQP
jgi:hypothetical protein